MLKPMGTEGVGFLEIFRRERVSKSSRIPSISPQKQAGFCF